MKKVLSLLLVVVFMFALAVPVSAAPAMVEGEIAPLSTGPSTRINHVVIQALDAGFRPTGARYNITPHQPAGQDVWATIRVPAAIVNSPAFRVEVQVNWGSANQATYMTTNMASDGWGQYPWRSVTLNSNFTFTFDFVRNRLDAAQTPGFSVTSRNSANAQRHFNISIKR